MTFFSPEKYTSHDWPLTRIIDRSSQCLHHILINIIALFVFNVINTWRANCPPTRWFSYYMWEQNSHQLSLHRKKVISEPYDITTEQMNQIPSSSNCSSEHSPLMQNELQLSLLQPLLSLPVWLLQLLLSSLLQTLNSSSSAMKNFTELDDRKIVNFSLAAHIFCISEGQETFLLGALPAQFDWDLGLFDISLTTWG